MSKLLSRKLLATKSLASILINFLLLTTHSTLLVDATPLAGVPHASVAPPHVLVLPLLHVVLLVVVIANVALLLANAQQRPLAAPLAVATASVAPHLALVVAALLVVVPAAPAASVAPLHASALVLVVAVVLADPTASAQLLLQVVTVAAERNKASVVMVGLPLLAWVSWLEACSSFCEISLTKSAKNFTIAGHS